MLINLPRQLLKTTAKHPIKKRQVGRFFLQVCLTVLVNSVFMNQQHTAIHEVILPVLLQPSEARKYTRMKFCHSIFLRPYLCH